MTARYANGAMLPCPLRLAQAAYVKRDPETDEISWPPSDMALQLIELRLITEPHTEDHQ